MSRSLSKHRPPTPPQAAAAQNELQIDGVDKNALADVYRAHGVCIVRGLISPDTVSDLDVEARRLFRAAERGEIPIPHIARRPSVDGGGVFERIDPVCEHSRTLRELAVAPKLVRLASAVIDGRPSLFKDKLIYKMPGDRGYVLHQDYPYLYECEMPAGAVTTVLLAIDAMHPENGCLGVYTGYHDRLLEAPPNRPWDVTPQAVSADRRHEAILDPGDVLFFHPLTPHESGPNLTAFTRRALYLTYVEALYADQREKYYRHRTAWAQGGPFR